MEINVRPGKILFTCERRESHLLMKIVDVDEGHVLKNMHRILVYVLFLTQERG